MIEKSLHERILAPLQVLLVTHNCRQRVQFRTELQTRPVHRVDMDRKTHVVATAQVSQLGQTKILPKIGTRNAQTSSHTTALAAGCGMLCPTGRARYLIMNIFQERKPLTCRATIWQCSTAGSVIATFERLPSYQGGKTQSFSREMRVRASFEQTTAQSSSRIG